MEEITLEDLQRYQELKREIRAIKYRIDQIRYSSPPPREVIGGRASVSVPGDPTERKALDIAEETELLESRLRELMVHREKIKRFVYFECEDALVRNVIAIHYLDGKTWAQTSWICFRSTNKSTSQMVINRYFRENDNDDIKENQ